MEVTLRINEIEISMEITTGICGLKRRSVAKSNRSRGLVVISGTRETRVFPSPARFNKFLRYFNSSRLFILSGRLPRDLSQEKVYFRALLPGFREILSVA